MKQLAVPGFWSWSQYNEEKRFDFNGHLWTHADGNVLIDPVPMSKTDLEHLQELGGAKICIITNADHIRAAPELKEQLGFEVVCHALDAEAVGMGARTVEDGDEIVPGMIAMHTPHGKTPGEMALLLVDAATVIFGDLVQGVPVGSLRVLPDAKLVDPARACIALRRLLPLRLQNIIVGDGQSLFGAGREALVRCLMARPDMDVDRVNVDEVSWSKANDDPRYQHHIKQISRTVGAQQLGYNVRRLPPGAVSGPMHFHRNQEELFYVLEGGCTLERPNRKLTLRQGDFVACLAGERGAHTLHNDGDEPCTVICVSNLIAHDERELVGLVDFRFDLLSP